MESMEKEIQQTKIMKLVVEDPSMILVLKEEYVTDDLWIFCIQMEPSLFRKIRHPSLKICYAAIEADGMNIKRVQKVGYDITPRMALAAVKNNPAAIFSIPKELWAESLLELACNGDPSLIKEFHNELREDYINRKLRENPSIIQYIDATDEQKIETLKIMPQICVYFSNPSPRLVEAMRTYAPEFYSLMYKNDTP